MKCAGLQVGEAKLLGLDYCQQLTKMVGLGKGEL